MGVYNEALTIVQSGRESTKGTLVATTSKTAVERIIVRPKDQLARPKLLKGLKLANRGNELAVMRGIEWEIPDTPVIYNQLQQFLAMAYKGGVTPTGANPYTWTYPRDPTIHPTLDSRTFEVRQTDGATPNDWKFGYTMLEALEFTGAENEPLKFNARGYARRIQTATLTAAQALPSIAIPPMALSQVYIDSTWANLGTTAIAGQVLGWKYRFETGSKPLMTADARSDLDFTVDIIDEDAVRLAIELVILATAGGQWATEKTAAEAGTLRAVEIRAVVGADSLKLQGLAKHTPGSVFPDDLREGQRIVTLRLEGSTDDTNFAQAILINSKSAMD